jgi:hypothetical protein
MPDIKVTLSIGYPSATHEDVITIDDGDWDACETDKDREELMVEAWTEWSNGYIEGYYELIEKP